MEPERQIEKLLRAVAKKRREQSGDPFELKPAAREQLHKEISRRAPGKSGGTFLANLFSGFHPRLAFVLCSLVIVSIGGWLLMPALRGRKPATLASADVQLAETPPTFQNSPMPAPLPPTTVAPSVAEDRTKAVFNDNSATVSGSTALKLPQAGEAGGNREPVVADGVATKQSSQFKAGKTPPGSSAGIPPASPPPVEMETAALKPAAQPTGSFANTARLDSDAADNTRRSIAPPTVAKGAVTSPTTIAAATPEAQKKLSMEKAPDSSATGSAAFTYGLAKDETTVAVPVASQRFYRTEAPAKPQHTAGALSVPARVLVSFKVEQNGGQIRVVDADGSIYTGILQVAQNENYSAAAASAPPQSDLFTTRAAKTRQPEQPPAQNYFFRVAGTNRNLNQNIVFSGNLIPLTNVLLASTNAAFFGGGAGGGGSGGAQNAMQGLPAASLLSNSRISGKVVIGTQKEVEVNATPGP